MWYLLVFVVGGIVGFMLGVFGAWTAGWMAGWASRQKEIERTAKSIGATSARFLRTQGAWKKRTNRAGMN